MNTNELVSQISNLVEQCRKDVAAKVADFVAQQFAASTTAPAPVSAAAPKPRTRPARKAAPKPAKEKPAAAARTRASSADVEQRLNAVREFAGKLAEGAGFQIGDVIAETGLSRVEAGHVLKKLIKLGELKSEGERRHTTYSRMS